MPLDLFAVAEALRRAHPRAAQGGYVRLDGGVIGVCVHGAECPLLEAVAVERGDVILIIGGQATHYDLLRDAVAAVRDLDP